MIRQGVGLETPRSADRDRSTDVTGGSEREPEPTVAPRWARRVAVLAVLTTVPSGIWRCSMALGLPVGVDESYRREHYGFPGWGTVYLFGLTLLLVGLALLTLGLVRRWGEVTPRWIPYIGARRVPRLAAIIPAGAGAVALTVLWASVFSSVGEIFDLYGLEGTARVVVTACYVPLLLWGPLLAAVTVSYARRTRSLAARSGFSQDAVLPPASAPRRKEATARREPAPG